MKVDIKGASILSASKRESTFGDPPVSWKLFLDDERYPVHPSWIIARNYDDALWYVRQLGVPNVISFDHDLGAPQNPTGYDFAKWLCAYIEDYELDFPDDFVYYIHSQNPVGAENIRAYMENFLRYYRG
jgi:hypothetical protein